MSFDAAQHRSGKGSGDENFPVASWLVAPQHRRPILAFYEFVRIADDIADHATLPERDKLAHLDWLEASLLGRDDDNASGVVLRAALAERGLSPQHAQDLLKAFRQDVTKHRYAARFRDSAADGDTELAQDVPAMSVAVERVRAEVESVAVAEVRHGAPAEIAAPLENRHGTPGAREKHRRGEPGQTAADNDYVL